MRVYKCECRTCAIYSTSGLYGSERRRECFDRGMQRRSLLFVREISVTLPYSSYFMSRRAESGVNSVVREAFLGGSRFFIPIAIGSAGFYGAFVEHIV